MIVTEKNGCIQDILLTNYRIQKTPIKILLILYNIKLTALGSYKTDDYIMKRTRDDQGKVRPPPSKKSLIDITTTQDPTDLTDGTKITKVKKYKVVNKCQHGRPKYRCKDCGTGYCDHGRQKAQCKECGIGYCEHDRPKSRCRDCGKGYCQHGRLKNQCRDCERGYCEHKRIKYKCRDCERGYCKHNRLQNTCNLCIRDKLIMEIKRADADINWKNKEL